MKKISTITVLVAMAFMMSAVSANALLTVGYDAGDQQTIYGISDYPTFDDYLYSMEGKILW